MANGTNICSVYAVGSSVRQTNIGYKIEVNENENEKKNETKRKKTWTIWPCSL